MWPWMRTVIRRRSGKTVNRDKECLLFLPLPLLLVQFPLHAAQGDHCLIEARLLLERLTIMPRRFEIAVASFINSSEIEVRKRVRIITRRQQRPLEPAHATVSITLGEKITADVVVGIAESFVDLNCCETFGNRLVITFLKAVDPTQERVRFGRRIGFNRSFI